MEEQLQFGAVTGDVPNHLFRADLAILFLPLNECGTTQNYQPDQP
jgi:hypothetical protein